MIAINGVADHIHFVIGMKPTCTLSDLHREIKKSTSDFIKENKFTKIKFKWQEGYGAFSVSPGALDKAVNYVMNQKEHHKKQTFKEEYLRFLKEYEIEYNEKYLFDWM